MPEPTALEFSTETRRRWEWPPDDRRRVGHYALWLHVDGAYGAPAVLTSQYRQELEPMALADSPGGGGAGLPDGAPGARVCRPGQRLPGRYSHGLPHLPASPCKG